MDFISNKELQVKEMLAAIGVENFDDLLQGVPEALRLPAPVTDDGLSEFEGLQHMRELASRNELDHWDHYLGAGAYEHHIPALVAPICQKGEFLTCYTPYQAEASQGMLQVIFEFQSAICAITGMDVANASLYDGASACAEGVLMALRARRNKKGVYIAGSLHPHYRKVVEQYLEGTGAQLRTLDFDADGALQLPEGALEEDTAAVLIQSPNFFGRMEEVDKVVAKAKEVKALVVMSANPVSYGIYRSAADWGVDIAVGDTQPFGLPLAFGGPYCGYIACTSKLTRQMPGRIAGETVDLEGKRGFVLTLQAREQHIRRDKATSNICSNQALAALASLVTMLWYGKEGVKNWAQTNFQRASYLREALSSLPGVEKVTQGPIFNEFLVQWKQPVYAAFRKERIEPGLDVSRYFPSIKNGTLVAVTETKSKEQLDRYIAVAKEVMG